MCTTRSRGGPPRIQRTRHVHWSDNLRPGGAKNAIQHCTRHTVRPGPANLPRSGQEQDNARDPQTTAQSPSSVPFGWGTPLKDSNVNATAKRSPTHRYALGRWDVGPIARVRPEHRQRRASALRREACTPPQPGRQAPPLVRTRSDAEPRKGDAGNPTGHKPTDLPAPPATLRKATSDGRPHA